MSSGGGVAAESPDLSPWGLPLVGLTIGAFIRNDPALQRDVGTLAQEAAAGGKTKAGAVFNEGDVLYPKIGGLKLMAAAGEGGKVVATLAKTDEMIYMGEEQSGFVKVESGSGSGWVKKILVAK